MHYWVLMDKLTSRLKTAFKRFVKTMISKFSERQALTLTQDSSKLISRNIRQQHIRTLSELAMLLLTVIGDKTLRITSTDVTNGYYSMVLIPTTSDTPRVFVCLCYHWLQFPKDHVLPPLGSIFTLLLSMIRSILFIPQLGIIICISTATTFTYIIKGRWKTY